MIQFARLLSYPATFKHLEKNVKPLNINTINASLINNIITVKTIINEHELELNVFDNQLRPNSPCKIYCDCDFFKFSLAYGLYKADALLYPERFVLKPPKTKNTFLTLSGCKHIILVARAIYQNRNIITYE